MGMVQSLVTGFGRPALREVNTVIVQVLTELRRQTENSLPDPHRALPLQFPRIWWEHGNSIQLSNWVRLKSQAVRTKELELIDWRASSVGLIRFL